MRTATLLAAALASLGACSAPDVCAPYRGRSCVAVELSAAQAIDLDQIAVGSSELGLAGARTPSHRDRLYRLPVVFPLLPNESFVGTFELQIQLWRDGQSLARASASSEIRRSGDHRALRVDLGSPWDLAPPSGQDAAPPSDGGTAANDLGTAQPPDHECGILEAWTATSHGDPECRARRVAPLGYAGAAQARGTVAIARSGFDEVVIASYRESASAGAIDLARVLSGPLETTFQAIPPAIEAVGLYSGGHLSLAAGTDNDEQFYLAYRDRDQRAGQPPDSIWLRTFAAHSGSGTVEKVAESSSFDGPVHVAVGSDGTRYVAWWAIGEPSLSAPALAISERPPGVSSPWTNRSPSNANAPDQLSPPPPGRRRLAGLVAGLSPSLAIYRPSEASGDGAELVLVAPDSPATRSHWLPPFAFGTLVDSSDYVGYDVSLSLFGPLRYAAYFRWSPSSSLAPTLELAVWQGTLPWPSTTSYLPLATLAHEPSQAPGCHVSLAVDGWGALHLLVLTTPSTGSYQLEYWRQSLLPDGAFTWLKDVVTAGQRSGAADIPIAMVVSPGGKPHIVYAVDNEVWYATRTDR